MRYVSGTDFDAVWDREDTRRTNRIARTKTRRGALKTWKALKQKRVNS